MSGGTGGGDGGAAQDGGGPDAGGGPPPSVCGNGTVEAGETCDLAGGQSPTCGPDCLPLLNPGCVRKSRLGHRYSFCGAGLDWPAAEASCAAARAHLLRIDDGPEAAWVKQHASWNSLGDYWTGLNDRAVSGQYVWADGQPLGSGFSTWMLGHPWSGADCTNADYKAEWRTRDCTLSLDYVCESYRPTPLTCGNGTVEPGEACDDAGESAACDADCTVSFCGDGVLNRSAAEQCDDGDDTGGCPATCQSPSITATPAVFYDFDENGGTTIRDTGGGAATDLTIVTPGAVTWVPGGLQIGPGSEIRTAGAATELLTACGASGAYTIEAWFVPDATLLLGDSGWHHIVSLSAGPTEMNASVYQDGRATGLVSRTSSTGADGLPSLESHLLLHPGVNHVAITREASGLEIIYVDDGVVENRTLTGNLSTWNAASGLWLGNVPGGTGNDWSGTLLQVAIYCRALSGSELLTNYYSVP